MRIVFLLLLSIILVPTHSHSELRKELRYPHLKGKIIRNVLIKIKDVFDDSQSGFIYRQANSLKINTMENVIRREVLLKEGKEFNEALLEQTERNLRVFRFLSYAEVKPIEENGFLDILVTVQDTWTLIPQVGFSTGTGNDRASIGLQESNFLGYGKKLTGRFTKQDDRNSIETAYSDPRFWGTQATLNAAIFDRSDGQITFFDVGRPYRSFSQKGSWSFSQYDGDTVGRLFQNGEERYIFRQENVHVNGRYSYATGSEETAVHRISMGYDYVSDTFTQADEEDYEDLNLDPSVVSNDPSQLASDRRFTGPSLSYHYIEPNFIKRDYIDRFERFDDYNLGTEWSTTALIAPKTLGSDEDTFLFSASRSGGWKFGNDAFLRGEMGYTSRFDDDGASNTIYRGELKFYDILGPRYLKELYIGKHTLAASIFFDYADDLDKDRELLVGGDNVIRGYEARTFTGDKRFGINLEDRMHFIDDLYQLVSLGGAVFFDAGGATRDAFGNLITEDFYSDVGFGLRIAFPRSTGSQVLRIDISYPLRDGPDGSGQFEPRILLSGGQIFDSKLRSEVLGTERANLDIGFDR